MNDNGKVYVCFLESMWEGAYPPVIAFDTEEKAQAWCKDKNENTLFGEGYDYRELEVE